DKFGALCRILDIEDHFYGLIFCRTRSDVGSLATRLMNRGYDAEAIHGDISQAQRERTLGKFRKQKVNIASVIIANFKNLHNLAVVFK
ncbi:unnamed protein product, partial [marine sediment metagenome]